MKQFVVKYDGVGDFLKKPRVQDAVKAIGVVGGTIIGHNTIAGHSREVKKDNFDQSLKIREKYENNEISKKEAYQITNTLGITCETLLTQKNENKRQVIQKEEQIHSIKTDYIKIKEYIKHSNEQKKLKKKNNTQNFRGGGGTHSNQNIDNEVSPTEEELEQTNNTMSNQIKKTKTKTIENSPLNTSKSLNPADQYLKPTIILVDPRFNLDYQLTYRSSTAIGFYGLIFIGVSSIVNSYILNIIKQISKKNLDS